MTLTLTLTLTLTKPQLLAIVKEIRSKHSNNIDYINGNDICNIKEIYNKIISVSGEKINRIDKTRILVVQYYNTENEVCSLNLSYVILRKHVPNIIYMK